LKDLGTDCLSFLIPETTSEETALALIGEHHKKIFDAELMAWRSDERDWPKNRTVAMFRRWFDVELHSEVIDLLGMRIEKEDYVVL